MLKKIVPIIILVALIAGGIFLVRKKKAAISHLPLPVKQSTTVTTALAVPGEMASESVRLGRIMARQPARLAARISAHILELRVREGDRVRAGEILVRLDDRREKDRIAALKADLAAARTQLETDTAIFARDRKLFAAKAISQEARDRSRARHDASRARVTALEKALATALTDLSYTLIKAPADGVISERLADPGDLATPGRPLLGFEDTTAGYFVRVNIPQAEFTDFRVGTPVRILPDRKVLRSPAPEAEIVASVSRLHPAVGKATLATLEIDLPDQPFALPTGALVRVALAGKKISGWRLPGRAVLENVGKAYVFCVDGKNRIHIVPVRVRVRNGNRYLVEGELDATPRVVVAQESALLRLHENMPVRIAE